MVGSAAKREGVAHLQAVMGLSERRACSIVNADRTMIRYRCCPPPDTLFVLLRQNGDPSGDQPHLPARGGRRFRILNIVDDVTRECLAAIPDTSRQA
jgi:hypothetical protein